MTQESPHPSAEDFLTQAVRLKYLTSETSERLKNECRESGVIPAQLVIQKGLLDAVQTEVIQSLLRPRDVIPGYEIIDLLGRGGMGLVFRARQLNLNRPVALKTVLVNRMSSQAALGRFEQEARTVAQLRHPHIVAAHDFGRYEGRVFFAMELVEGQDADELIRQNGRLEVALAWGLARQVASALAHAGGLGVVHRDIKPGNLLLIDPPEGLPFPPGLPMVKVADFGLSLCLEDDAEDSRTRLTSENVTVGSPHYMAPEQLESSRVDFRADIYALGATVYHMLSGQPPFGGLRLSQVMAQKLKGDPEPLSALVPGLPAATCELVSRLMARDPEQRPGSHVEVLALIDRIVPAFQQALPAGSLSVSDAVPAARTQLRRRSILLAASLCGLIFIAASAWYFGPADDSRPMPPGTVSMRRQMRERGAGMLLFNGLNTSGWQQRGGNWIVPPGSASLTGTDGQLVRTLFRAVSGRPESVEFYRLILFVDRRQSAAVEVQFGFAAGMDRNGPRYALRWTEQGFTVGERLTEYAGFQSAATPASPPGSDEIAVIIERQPGGWFVSVNERLIDARPLHPEGELPEFRLLVEGGTASFSEIELTELVPATPEHPAPETLTQP